MQKKLVSFNEIRNNNIKSIFLFFVFLILIGLLGILIGLIWGDTWFGFILALIIGFAYTLIAWYSGADMLLLISRAKPVTKQEYPYLFHTIEGLSLAAGIPTPKAYVINDSALNAFATGRDPKHAAVVVTTGLLKKMNREELEGVLAHEISHIKNYDIRSMMLAAILVGIVVLLSDFLLRSFLWGGRSNGDNEKGQAQIIFIVIGIALAILAPLIGELIKLSISRKREFAADAGAAVLTRYPKGLANALKKIKDDPDPLVDSANKATAHLFISTPFRKRKGVLMNLFNTHPPIEERIRRLEAM